MLDPSTDWSKVAVTSITLGQVKANGVLTNHHGSSK